MKDKTVTLTVAEFRKNTKDALDYALEGGVVIVDRMGQRFMINHIPRGVDIQFAKLNDKVFVANGVDPITRLDATGIDTDKTNVGKISLSSTPVGPNPFHRLSTDKLSSNIRPDIPKNPIEPSAHNEFTEALDASEQACCRKKAPCKHWQHDSDNNQWINSLSGRSREVEE